MRKFFPDDYKIPETAHFSGNVFHVPGASPQREPDVNISEPFTPEEYSSREWHENGWRSLLKMLNESPVESFCWGSQNMVKIIKIWRKK